LVLKRAGLPSLMVVRPIISLIGATPHECFKSTHRQTQAGPAESCRGARQCVTGLQDHGRLTRYVLSLPGGQGQWWRRSAAAEGPQAAEYQEPCGRGH